MTKEQKVALQRAGIMGAIVSILRAEEASLEEIKQSLATMFAVMIEIEAMVGDTIDMEVADACKDFLIQEQALKEAKNLFE